MADPLPPPPGLSGNIKFPGRPGAGKTLSLRRRARSPIEQTAEAVETREKINSIVAATRAPWGESQTTLSADKSAELEKALRELEGRLEERERACEELEVSCGYRAGQSLDKGPDRQNSSGEGWGRGRTQFCAHWVWWTRERTIEGAEV